jgi:hypothetical protein
MDIRKRSNIWRTVISCMSLMLLQLNSPFVKADGDDTLGTPSVFIEAGTTIVVAGVGLSQSDTGDINFSIPAGATVEQVLLYWHGYQDKGGGAGDDEITVNTNTVFGTPIGSPVLLNSDATAYRADITGLGLVSAGSNTLTIEDMDFNKVEHGAGVLVIIKELGVGLADIIVRDGNDYAYDPSPPRRQREDPEDRTVPQVFDFVSSTYDRTATLDMHFASVEGLISSGSPGVFRPSAIKVTVGTTPTPTVTVYDNLLGSFMGEEWDTISIDVDVPAGVTQIIVEAQSVDNGEPVPDGFLEENRGQEASLHWIAAGLSVPQPPSAGCTPGFYKNIRKHEPAWVAAGYDPYADFSSVFENAFPGMTLLDVLNLGGGGLNALGRHTVAALLNAAHPEIYYGSTDTGVIDAFNDVHPGSKADYTALKDTFADLNELGCPINGK